MKKLSTLIFITLIMFPEFLFSLQESVYSILNGGNPIETAIIDEAVLINIDSSTMLMVYTTAGELKAVKSFDAGQTFDAFSIDFDGRQISTINNLKEYNRIDNDWVLFFIGNEGQGDNLYTLILDDSGELSLGFTGPLNILDNTVDVTEYAYYQDQYKSFLTTYEIGSRLAFFHFNSFTNQFTKGYITSENTVLQNYYLNNDFDENDRMVFLAMTQTSDTSNSTTLNSIKLSEGLISENLEVVSLPPGDIVSNMFFLSNMGSHNLVSFTIDNSIFFYTYTTGIWNLINQIDMTSLPEQIIPGVGPNGIVYSSYFIENGINKFYYDIEQKTIEDEYIQISTVPLKEKPVQIMLQPDRLTYMLPEESGEYINLNFYSQIMGASTWFTDNAYYSPPGDIEYYSFNIWGGVPYIVTISRIGAIPYISLQIYDFNNFTFTSLFQEQLQEDEASNFILQNEGSFELVEGYLSFSFLSERIVVNMENKEVRTDSAIDYECLGRFGNNFYYLQNINSESFLSVNGMGE